MLVLASRSPRRAELLTAAGIAYEIRVADIDESHRPGESPVEYCARLAREKALAVPALPDEIVLGADTTVIVDDEIMGKPSDEEDAARMLSVLSGRRHEVITGVCLRRGDMLLVETATTAVWFQSLSDAEIGWYISSGEPFDKAGAYGIQGLASRFVDRIDGSWTNVVGLPVALVYRLLARLRSE
jgi:septum formation protein